MGKLVIICLQSEVNNLILGDNEIEWATGLRYLGVLFTSAKMLTVDMSICRLVSFMQLVPPK